MAKLKGPLFSIDARGKLGNSLVFSSNKGIKRASRHYEPTNPRTLIQQDNRSIFSYAISSWQSLTEGQKEDYNQSAANLKLKMSGYNYYIQTYLAAYGVGPPPPPAGYILDGLVSWWKIDENAGDNVGDSIGTNDGTRFGATWVPGKHNSALSFDANDDYVNMGNVFTLQSPHTIVAWVKTNTIKQTYAVHKWGDWGLGQNGGVWEWAIDIQGNGWIFVTGPAVVTGAWTFLTAGWTGTSYFLYVNNVPATPIAETNPPDETTDPMGLGNILFSASAYVWDGIIDEVAIYNRALSPAEIQQNYEAFL